MVTKLTLFFETLQKFIDSNKYYTDLCNNKGGNERLNKNNCVYFRKNLYYDVNFALTNFVLLDETCIRILLNYENVNIRKNPLRIFQCEFHILA
jgi:hypothetical protein